MIRKHTVLGAASAGALALVAAVGPAVAAGEESADVAYTCPTALGFTAHPSAHYVVDAPPATMVAGQKVALPTTGTVTIDAATTTLVVDNFSWAKFDAKIVTPTSGSTVGQNLTIPKTPMANGPGGSTVGTVSGNTLVRPTRAGTFTLNLGNLGAPTGLPAGAVTLNGYAADDTFINNAVFPDGGAFQQCTNDATKTPLEDSLNNPATVTVSKDASTTAVTAAYAKAKKQAIGTAKVKGKNFGLTGTGTVKFTLKKGLHIVAVHKGVKLNKKGIAKTVFKSVTKRGKYSIVAKYGGSAGLKASSGKDTFSVG